MTNTALVHLDNVRVRRCDAVPREGWPSVSAWLANQLVRQHRDQVGPLLDLGAALREATATLSGPALRQLSRQRNELISARVRQARRLASAAGQPVSEVASRGLEHTLNAALADPGAGEALLAGRLTEALRHTGFGSASDVLARADDEASTGRARVDELRAELAVAEASHGQADQAAAPARAEQETARSNAEQAMIRVTELRRELDAT